MRLDLGRLLECRDDPDEELFNAEIAENCRRGRRENP